MDNFNDSLYRCAISNTVARLGENDWTENNKPRILTMIREEFRALQYEKKIRELQEKLKGVEGIVSRM